MVALAQHADTQTASCEHAAVIRLLLFGQKLQKGRLAVAVLADDANAIAVFNANGDAIEHILRGEFQAYFFTRHHERHGASLLVRSFILSRGARPGKRSGLFPLATVSFRPGPSRAARSAAALVRPVPPGQLQPGPSHATRPTSTPPSCWVRGEFHGLLPAAIQ